MKLWDNVGDPSCFLMPLPIVYVTFCSADIRHKVPKSSKNRTNVKVFGPHFSGGTTPSFLQQAISAIYRPPFGRFD